MTNENQMRLNPSNSANGKLPRVNWLQHANASDNFLNQKKFLCSNLLFSLDAQKPPTEGTMAMRLTASHVQSFHRVQGSQVEKAWHALSSLKISSRNYLRPGKTGPVKNSGDGLSWDSGQRSVLQSSSNRETFSDNIDDDDLFKNIDVDQIAREHYQSTFTRCEERFMPPELVKGYGLGVKRHMVYGLQGALGCSFTNEIKTLEKKMKIIEQKHAKEVKILREKEEKYNKDMRIMAEKQKSMEDKLNILYESYTR